MKKPKIKIRIYDITNMQVALIECEKFSIDFINNSLEYLLYDIWFFADLKVWNISHIKVENCKVGRYTK